MDSKKGILTMACESGRFCCLECEESYPEESIFKCETCQIEQDTNSDTQSSSDHFCCDTCIIRHCKKGHKIMDSVSQPVMVCDKHKMMLNHYCHDCDILLCFKCMAQHDNHKLAPIEIRAKEIRMKVFEQLTNFENMEKPTRKQKERVLETTKANREKLQNVIKAFEKTQQSLLSKLDDADKKSKTTVESILEKQNELRGLLSLSSQNLVQKWKNFEKLNENVLMAKVDDESSVTEYWVMRDLVMKLSNNWFESLGVHLSCNVTDVESKQKIFSDTYDGEFYVVVVKGDSIELRRYSLDKKLTEYEFELVGTVAESNLSSSIDSIKARSRCKIILFMSDGSILMADFSEECITLCEIPAGRELLHPWYNFISEKVEWLYWENEHVICAHKEKFKIKFKSKPKVMSIDENCDDESKDIFCVFMNPGSMLITVVDFTTEKRIEIPQSVHGCKSIEFIDQYFPSFNMSLFYIALWSVKMKSVTLIQIKWSVLHNFKSEVIGRINWTDDLEIKECQTENEIYALKFSFLPAVEVHVSKDNAGRVQRKTRKWAFMGIVNERRLEESHNDINQ